MTVANSGFGMGNGQAYSQLFGIGNRNEKFDSELLWLWKGFKKKLFKFLGLGMGMKTMSPTQHGKKWPNQRQEKNWEWKFPPMPSVLVLHH